MKQFVVVFIESKWYLMDIEDTDNLIQGLNYNPSNTYITFQTSDLIRKFKSINRPSLRSNIIDLESFDKQMSQEGKDIKSYGSWKVLNFLRYHKKIDSDFRLSEQNIKSFLEKIGSLYKSLLNKDEEEKKRFEEVELKINKLIYQRQYLGIRVDVELAKKRCAELEKEIYLIKNKLQLKYNIFTPDNIKEQKNYLEKTNYRIINSYRYTFKIHKKEDVICDLFYELYRNQEDLDSLLFIISNWGGKQRAYPTFVGFGTITSRIILRQPALQNLRKTNRDIIIPDEGKKLFYIDYSQFEAGILASLSKDEGLIELYNSDIYEDIAQKVFGDKVLRKDAKILFYRYMYGDDSIKENVVKYFKQFKQLEKFKIEIENDLKQNSRIGIQLGNYRYMSNENNIWALSHKIQATASYIYKKSLLKVKEEVKDAEFLIPMHDGTVYQIDESKYEEVKTKVQKIYRDIFKEICPRVEPRLKCYEEF